ncbi:MAG: hypothetical protein JXB07_17355 [Anaerolineae bacterium]|nr:hypothetical protein [Anaerolineae bacterium]
MKKLLSLLTFSRLVSFVTLAAVFVMAARVPLDTDSLWHLRAGQWQVEHRALLQTDYFSHTRIGQPWINHSWLSQLILYGAYGIGSQVGLAVLTGILAVCAMALIYQLCNSDPIVRAFSVILGGAAAAIFWSARPQMFSFLLSAVVVYLLWLYQKRGIDRLWCIPPIMVLWANMHGGFAIGFILMVLATLGEGARWLLEGVLAASPLDSSEERPTHRPMLRLVFVGLVSAMAISINPYGPSMLLYPFRTVGIGVLRDYIQEWAAPDFHQAQTWPFLWLLLGTLLVSALSSKKLDWRDAVMVGGIAYSALLAARNIATFALVAVPVFASHLDAFLTEHRLRLNSRRIPSSIRLLVLNWGMAALIVIGVAGKILSDFEPSHLEQARREVFPTDAVAFLEREQPPGPLLNSYNWGGYLIWEARDYPVYVDGRTDLYDDDFLRGYLKTYHAQSGWDKRLDDSGVNTVLVEASSPLAQVLALTDDWSMAYTDARSSLFVRDHPRNSDR